MTNRIVQGTILGIVLSLLFNLLVYAVGRALDVSFLVDIPNQGAMTIGIPQIVMITLISVILGALLLWILARVSQNPLFLFLGIASIVALLSLLPVYGSAVGTGTFASLGLMHIITAGAAALTLAIFFQRCETCV